MKESLVRNKTSIEQQLVALREICEKANNWDAIRPEFQRLQGSLTNFFVAVEGA